MADKNATASGSNSAVKTLSLSSLLAKEERLLKQASQAMPHSFNVCTYDAPGGYIRQAIYLCKTCKGPDGEGRGLCAACSISCHAGQWKRKTDAQPRSPYLRFTSCCLTDHEQLELFPKRGFRCDCPTTAIAAKCTLHQDGKTELPNEENAYGQNFQGRFCR